MRLRALWVGFLVVAGGLVLPQASQAADKPGTDAINPAVPATLNGTNDLLTGSNVTFTNETGEANHAGAAVYPAGCSTTARTDCENSAWWRFTANSETHYTIDLCNSNPGDPTDPGDASDFDTVLALYQLADTAQPPSVTNVTKIKDNDDRTDKTGCSNDRSSQLDWTTTGASPGTPKTYYIAVAGFQKDAGNIHGVLVPCGTPGVGACSSQNANPPTATTDPAEFGSTTATLKGTVDANSQPIAWHFEYGTSATPYAKSTPPPADGAGTETGPDEKHEHANVTGLTPSTTYHFRIVVQYSGGTVNGLDRTFTTLANAPSAITKPADTLTGSSATLHGTVDAKGKATTFQFDWGVCTDYEEPAGGTPTCHTTTYSSKAPGTPGTVGSPTPPDTSTKVATTITGLSQYTHYHFRVTATNSDGTDRGFDVVFTTPLVQTDPVGNRGFTKNVGSSATLNATIKPQGEGMLFRFEYGKDTKYGTTVAPNDPPGDDGSSPEVTPSFALSGLDANTTYHYRIVAQGDSGTTMGSDVAFATFGPPGATTLLPTETTVDENGVRVALNGIVNPHGIELDADPGGVTYWFEFGTTAAHGQKTAVFRTPNVATNDPPDLNDYPVSIPITKRTLGQVYHYSLVAENAAGKTIGPDKALLAGGDPIYTDPNGDDKRDLVWHNRQTGATTIWTMNNNHYVAALAVDGVNNPPVAWNPVATADFNNDGKTDLLWHNASTGAVSIWLMNANHYTGSVAIAGVGTPPPYFRPSAVADFNADGYPDIVWHNNKTGKNSIWILHGTTFMAPAIGIAPSPGTAWRPTGAGDFNGDGKPDIVLHNFSTGRTSAWLMNGTAYGSAVAIYKALPTAWAPVGTGQFDFDGNGQTDILWFNRRTHTTSIWYMNGSAFGTAATVDGIGNPGAYWYPI